MSKQILVLPGDGIGPEIMAEAVKVLNLANDKYALGFELSFDDLGGAAIDRYGVPLADETLDRARAADAVLSMPSLRAVARSSVQPCSTPSATIMRGAVASPSASKGRDEG